MVSRISRLSAIRKAGRWQRGGVQWHFHLFSPGCLLNPTKFHELFLESARGNYVVRSHSALVPVGRHLVHILSGKSVTRFSTAPPSSNVALVLKRAVHLNHKKVAWHHHLLFPHCMFNKKWGKWAIAFEDPLNNKLTILLYPAFPREDLKKVERLFYAQTPASGVKRKKH